MKGNSIDNIINILRYMHKLKIPIIPIIPIIPEKLKEEIPTYAIYSIKGPKKILMLLKPRLHEVTYTPLGIEFLKLNRNKLPPYQLITNFIAQHNQKFVLLPYIKGRSEQEIERLISEQIIVQEYEIKDIIPTEIYKGKYGAIYTVGKNLKPITSCQKNQYIVLQQALRNSPFYQEFINNPKEFDFFLLGEIMLGKNNDYVIMSDVGFEAILHDIRNCGRVYYLVGVTKDLIMASEPDEVAHGMGIIIDPQAKTLEVFDPNGFTTDTRHIYFWSTQLINYLKQQGINLERKLTVDEPFCPQQIVEFAPEFRGEEQCLVWSFWYIWLRVNNPTVPLEAIRRYMMRMSPSEAFDRVRKIASIAFS
jgi:hypothetical protein